MIHVLFHGSNLVLVLKLVGLVLVFEDTLFGFKLLNNLILLLGDVVVLREIGG